MDREKIVDLAWKVSAIGLTLVWQHPVEVLKVRDKAKFDVITGQLFKGVDIEGVKYLMHNPPSSRSLVVESQPRKVRRVMVFA